MDTKWNNIQTPEPLRTGLYGELTALEAAVRKLKEVAYRVHGKLTPPTPAASAVDEPCSEFPTERVAIIKGCVREIDSLLEEVNRELGE
jgi:hypothetical protein